jgi:hypothetical protein
MKRELIGLSKMVFRKLPADRTRPHNPQPIFSWQGLLFLKILLVGIPVRGSFHALRAKRKRVIKMKCLLRINGSSLENNLLYSVNCSEIADSFFSRKSLSFHPRAQRLSKHSGSSSCFEQTGRPVSRPAVAPRSAAGSSDGHAPLPET